jgi:hypothetical protein
MEQIDEETNEDYIKRLAYNRYQMRMHFRWKLNETAEDDYRVAKELYEREQKANTSRYEADSDSGKPALS